MGQAEKFQKISDRSFVLSVVLDCAFIVDAFTFRIVTGGVVDFFPTWVTIMLGVGLTLTVIGSALMKYAIQSKKLDPSDTLFNLFFRVLHEVLIFTIFFSLFASQISSNLGIFFSTCDSNSWALNLQILVDRLIKMLSLDILDIAGFSISSCELNRESPYSVSLAIVFHLAATFIMVPYLVAMIRHSSGGKVRSWLGRKAG